MTLEPDAEEDEKVFFDEYGTPVADEPAHWSPEISLKVDLLVLDTVYAMEEKITNASMQNKVRSSVCANFFFYVFPLPPLSIYWFCFYNLFLSCFFFSC